MKEWLAPQISEHCPTTIELTLEDIKACLKRPGVQSTFIPKEGTDQEWITSSDVKRTREVTIDGKFKTFLIFNKRDK